MKFDLTIKDASWDDIQGVLNKLNSGAGPDVEPCVTTAQTQTPTTAPPISQSAPESVPVIQTYSAAEALRDVLIAQNAPILPPISQPTPTVAPKQTLGEGIDAEGLPWDERIHSSRKKKTKKNIWVRRKGLQEDKYEQVKAELLNQTSEPASVIQQSVIPPHTPPAVTPPPLPTQPAPVRDFNHLLNRIQQGFQQGKCTPAYIPQFTDKLKQYNPAVTAVTDIKDDPQLVEVAHAIMDQDGI